MTAGAAELIVYWKLSELRLNPGNTLFASCVCPDEINHDNPEEGMISRMRKRWGSSFSIGGLGGVPFAGKAGWAELGKHCPENGHIVVCFAPHVGIDSKGEIGRVLRKGHHESTVACSGSIGAYETLLRNVDKKSFGEAIQDS